MDASTYKKRMRLAKLLLTGSVFAMILSLVFPWDRLEFISYRGSASNVTETRSTSLVVMAASLGISHNFWGLSHFRYPIARVALVLIATTFLFAPIYTSWLSRMTPLKASWITLDYFLLAAFIGGWFGAEKHYISLFDFEQTHRHLHFLAGLYFAILAVLLHFAGLLLIPSARSLDRPAVPASE
ncbi:MAG: hypothetical protein CFE26_12695 [Verrucomicrobiales bacterium VVV1]|nr:MAG: hypothetical protein CFE26_12695 [Verrucomicrobiales bacterium VVV1]